MSIKANVWFEIETINRELDFRLFLASLCVNPETRIYIGQQEVIFSAIRTSKNGLYVGKNIRPAAGLDKGVDRYQILKSVVTN